MARIHMTSGADISTGSGDEVEEVDGEMVLKKLGYSRKFLRIPVGHNGSSSVAAIYVNRVCEGGCERTFKFTPLPGLRREQYCSRCKRRTMWRVVP
jgi:hypothetical protein